VAAPVVAGRITPIDELYRQTYVPHVTVLDPEDWTLTMDGLVKAPLNLVWTDLQTFEPVEQMQTLECIGNPVGGRLIGNVVWRGVRLRDVLARAEAAAAARYLVMSSADDYFTCVPLELALDERSLLATEANGAPLPRAHGYPARMVLPGVYGQKQPKWVTSLRLSDTYVKGTWEKDGWSDTARVQVNSRIEQPAAGQALAAGTPTLLSGVAFADPSGVTRLEVSTDGGSTWAQAELHPGPDTTVWTVWSWEWLAPLAGRHAIQARATDGNGIVQAGLGGVLSDVFPDGTSGIHQVVVTAA
jgi:DMSO/TMAO reductase YedYZ molybdopterin-dependent catalytic subunit